MVDARSEADLARTAVSEVEEPEPNRGAAGLYRTLAPAVLGYLRAQGARDPEDLLGEVFLQVTRDLPRFKGDAARLRSWVFSIAHNRLIDDGRRRAARPQPSDAAVPELQAPEAEASLDPTLVRALDGLTSDQREVVILRFVVDLSLADVARITHRRVGAVKALQARALENLSKAVSPDP